MTFVAAYNIIILACSFQQQASSWASLEVAKGQAPMALSVRAHGFRDFLWRAFKDRIDPQSVERCVVQDENASLEMSARVRWALHGKIL